MLNKFEEFFATKKILILGFGVEGRSTYRFLRKILPEKMLWIADLSLDINKYELISQDNNLVLKLGNDYLKDLHDFDMIVKTPGISLKNIPENDFSRFTSHTELFIRFFRDQIIGITGTKGKSTTSSLIHHIITSVNPNCLLVGNIGQPPFDLIDQIDEKTIIVYELSSHQLEQTCFSPRIAILLNIFQEHLDHFGSYEKYQEAKFRITSFQRPDDYFIYHAGDEIIIQWIKKTGIQRNFYPFSLSEHYSKGYFLFGDNIMRTNSNNEVLLSKSDIQNLKGDHNVLNILAALNGVMLLIDIPVNELASSIVSFKPLEHRLELVGENNGIIFYNDSISTIPEATIAAVRALKEVDTLILGGYDREVYYDDFIDFIEKSGVNNLIFIGDAGLRMNRIYKSKSYKSKKVITAYSFLMAVEEAKRITRVNKICLLSPAAASYGMFKNFAERGRVFKSLVREQNIIP